MLRREFGIVGDVVVHFIQLLQVLAGLIYVQPFTNNFFVPIFINSSHQISCTKLSKAVSRIISLRGWKNTSIVFMGKGRLNKLWTT